MTLNLFFLFWVLVFVLLATTVFLVKVYRTFNLMGLETAIFFVASLHSYFLSRD